MSKKKKGTAAWRECFGPLQLESFCSGVTAATDMYAVKVNVRNNAEDAELSEEASRLASELLVEQSLEATGSSDHLQDEVSFSAGNPRVEHLTGKVHLYRQISTPEQALQHRNQLPVSLCCL